MRYINKKQNQSSNFLSVCRGRLQRVTKETKKEKKKQTNKLYKVQTEQWTSSKVVSS
jgi:hypothetical protein